MVALTVLGPRPPDTRAGQAAALAGILLTMLLSPHPLLVKVMPVAQPRHRILVEREVAGLALLVVELLLLRGIRSSPRAEPAGGAA